MHHQLIIRKMGRHAPFTAMGTASGIVIMAMGEWRLQMPHRGLHLGFIEKWWLVNPLALLGIAIACFGPQTGITHAGHVPLITWASPFHVMMALGKPLTPLTAVVSAVFIFFAVWIPCCTSDIVFPLLWIGPTTDRPSAPPPATWQPEPGMAARTMLYLPPERRTTFGVAPHTVRLSAGIEPVAELLADLEQALHHN